jgi:hypothetical protein
MNMSGDRSASGAWGFTSEQNFPRLSRTAGASVNTFSQFPEAAAALTD